jgi:hypothetical protein
MLDRNAILTVADLPVAGVEVPEWGEGEIVYVRALSACEAEEKLKGIDKLSNFHGRFAALVLCDPAGNRIFQDADADALGRKSLAALRRICDVAQEHNGMTEKSREETEKNSETIRAGSSGSTSPEN